MKGKIQKLIIIALLLLPTISFAQSSPVVPPGAGGNNVTVQPGVGGVPNNTNPVKLTNPLKVGDIQALLLSIVDLAIFIGAIFAIFMFFWVGFKFVMARGNENELKKAKEMFLYIVIGTAILISSKVIVEVVKNTFIASGLVDKNAFILQK